ncbi:MAG: hypothetical protein JRI23_00900 [Deltaproteobacteria bacterium]|jgi:hypothetical protein|nr:hypothetical protein [Deltaproteobacteria bacterium]MBW2530011.1 hypothetical protein [Deltaproteobacteria bacterium]
MVRRLLRASGGAAVVASLLALGCGGQSKYMEDEQWSREPTAEGGAWREAQSLFTPEESNPDTFEGGELNGVRLDLSMDPQAEPTARCNCLHVAAGRPSDKIFSWSQEVPVLSGEQMVVAVRSEGADCPADPVDPTFRRASIKAVDIKGNNVIVVIEKLPVGRPLAHGAVTSRPKPGGSLYLRPANKKVPYGGALGGKGMCSVFTRGAQ